MFSFSIKNSDLDLLDTTIQEDEQVLEQLNNTIRLLGQELACDYKLFTELLPEMLNQNSDRLFELGKGLAIGCTNLEQMWLEFYYALSSNLCIDTNNTQALCGFFNVLTARNNKLAKRILDQAVTDKVLAPIFMQLQTSVQLDEQGVKRIRQSIQYGAVPIQQYVYIAYGRYHENISDNDYCEIMRDILLKDGFDIVLDMFLMRIQKNTEDYLISEATIAFGRELLLMIHPSRNVNFTQKDYKLSKIMKRCLIGEDAVEISIIIIKRFIEALVNHDIHVKEYKNILKELAKIQPKLIVSMFLSIPLDNVRQIRNRYLYWNHISYFPISFVDDKLILKWCADSPDTSYLILAASIIPYRNTNDDSVRWTPLALKIINRALDPIAILDEFKYTIRPLAWSGSRSELMQRRLMLFSELLVHQNKTIQEWAFKAANEFQEEINSTRDSELKMSMDHYNDFE